MPKQKDPTIYELLAKQQMSATTITQLDAATKSTFIDVDNVEFWAGVITVSRALESRTMAHGLPIAETGSTATVTIADSANAPIKPSGTEIWAVQNVNFDGCTAAYTDADGNYSIIASAPSDDWNNVTIYMSANLFLTFFNGTGSEQTPSIAYFKVAL